MKEIKLTRDKIALVDDEDFPLVSQWKWSFSPHRSTKGYAKAHPVIGKYKQTTVRMHRLILGAKKSEQVDHINGDTLDNRRANIRICSVAQNARNRGVNRNNKSSGLKGVSICPSSRENPWKAMICFNYKKIHLGVFRTKEDAHVAYNKAAKIFFGEFAGTMTK